MARRIWKELPGGKVRLWKESSDGGMNKSGTWKWRRNLERRRRRRVYKQDHEAWLEVKNLGWWRY